MNQFIACVALMALVASVAQGQKVRLSSSGPFQLQKGFSQTITFTLDEPIICSDPHAFCGVVVLVTNPSTRDLVFSTCQLKWTNADWNTPRTLNIKATENFVDDGEKTFIVKTNAVISASEYYSGFDAPDITIKTQSRRTATCSGTGDPHYWTFDGQYLHQLGPGQMVLYKAAWRDFEIQTRVWRRPAINCGIAAREGNNVVKFNFCPGDKNDVQIDFKSEKALQPKISLSGNQYTVNFASGASLWFQMYPSGEAYYINVYVSAPGMDAGKTTGLCGNFNGVAADDAPSYNFYYHNIAELPQHMQISSDLFQYVASPSPPSAPPPPFAAECPYVAPVVTRPVLQQGDSEDITDLLKSIQVQATNKPLSQYDFVDQPIGANPTLSPVDNDRIVALCTERIKNSDLGRVCSTIAELNLQTFVDNCIIDLQLMQGDERFITDAYNAMQTSCAEIAGRDLSTYVLVDGKLVPNPALTTKLCPNGCSGQGTCNQGVCTCNTGFMNVDCSFDSTSPAAASVVNPSICDAQTTNGCPASVLVAGSNFFDLEGITCRFGDVLTKATYVSPFSIQCALPAAPADRTKIVSVAVSIANDGQLFSTRPLKFTWFDSVCHICNATECAVNTNSCNIDGACYHHNAVSPLNACKTCQPAVSTTAWIADISNGFTCGPVFETSQYSVSLLDVTTAGTPLKSVFAGNTLVDPTISKVKYSLNPSSNPSISIDENTGVVSTNAAIDPKSFSTSLASFKSYVGLIATDAKGNIGLASLFLSIEGTNKAPVFAQSRYNFTIDENTAVGTVLGSVTATDPNAGQATAVSLKWDIFTFTWILQELGFGDTFAVNSTTGVVTTAKNIDFEQKTSFRQQLRVVDGGGLFSVADVVITVRDVNEAPTSVRINSSSIAENGAANAVVGLLSAVDPDANDTFTFVLRTSGTPFVIVGSTLQAQTPLDFETVSSYSLSIRVTDAKGLFTETTLVISVTDVNEAPGASQIAPVTSGNGKVVISGNSLTIKEDFAIQTPLASVSSADPDAGQQVSCGVTGSSLFQISGNQIVLAASLDFETAPSVTFRVACSDTGIPSMTSVLTTYTVTVTDANESGQNVKLTSEVVVPENAAVNSVVGMIEATDPDFDASTLSFSTAPSSRYVFASSTPVCVASGAKGAKKCTAQLLVRSALNFEANPTDSCEVITVDNHGLSSTSVVPIKLSDVNDAPTGVDLTNTVVMENSPTGTLVGSIIVVDADVVQSSYIITLKDTSLGRFAIKRSSRRDAQSGYDIVVADGSSIDFEVSPQLTVVLTVVDQGTPSSTTDFTVSITVSDRPMVPVFSALSVNSNTPIGRRVATISLEALDRADLIPTYSVSGAHSSYLTVVYDAPTRTANVLLAKSLTGSAAPSALAFTVVVVFGGDLAQPVQKSFTVSVTAVNQAPVFEAQYPAVYLTDDTNIGFTVVTVKATDPELNTIEYTLATNPSSARALFSIGSFSGVVTTANVPSVARISGDVQLTITASDGIATVNTQISLKIVNECFQMPNQAAPCSGNGECTPAFTTYSCACSQGFTGTDCDVVDIPIDVNVDANSANSANSAASAGIGAGAVAGIVIAIIVLIVIVCIVALVLIRQSKQAKPQPYRPSGSAIAAVDSDGQAVLLGNSIYDEAKLNRLGGSDFEPGVNNPAYAWYQPHMSRQDCEANLNAQGEGAFVVRDSSFTPGWHMLGVKSNNTVIHERIKLNPDGTYELLPSSNQHQPSFRAIPDLIEHYASMKRAGVTFALALDNPLYDNHLLHGRTAKPVSAHEADAPAVPSRYNDSSAI